MKKKKFKKQKIKTEESFLVNEEKYKNIISNIPVALYRCMNDENWTMIHISDTIEKLTGYPSSDFINNHIRSFSSIIDKKDNELLSEFINKALSEQSSFTAEYKISTRSGAIKWMVEQGSGVYNETGELLYIDGSLYDNTEKKHIEKSLKESEEKFKAFIENTTDAYHLLRNGYFIECNQAALAIWNCTREEMIGHSPIEFSPEFQPDGKRSDEKVKEKIEAALRGISQRFYWQHKTKEGQLLDEEVILKPIVYKGENVILTCGRDVTKQKNIERALRENEEKYRILVENQAEGISILDIDEYFLFANPAAERIFGVKEGQLLNRNLKEFMVAEQFKRIQQETQKRISGKKSTYEIEIINAKGVKKTLLVSSSPYLHKDGIYRGAFGIFRDISDLKKVEKALSESENRYKTLTEITDEGIIIHENGIILDVNPSLLRLLKTTEKNLIQRPVFDFIHPNYHDIVKQKMEEKYEGTYEIEIINQDGAIFPVELKTKNYLIDKVNKRVISIRDITERKKKDDILLKSKQELIKANATKDKFLSIIAHDLRSPFNAIIGFSELLLDRIKDNDLIEIEKFSQLILYSANQSSTLLSNLLVWARAQSSNFTISPERCQLEPLINRVVDLLKINANSKQIGIGTIIMKDIIVEADKQMLETVIRNLLSNAIKFTPSYGKITISTEILENNVQIAISDTGIGISTKGIAQIWQLGSNYITPGTNQESGTGLGLVLCREFIEKHKGKILVDSEPGKGTTFTVILPLNQ